MVTHRQRPATAQGITFINLEDETGLINVICSKGCWARYRRVARGAPALLVRGRLEKDEGVVNVVAERIEPLPVAGDGALPRLPLSGRRQVARLGPSRSAGSIVTVNGSVTVGRRAGREPADLHQLVAGVGRTGRSRRCSGGRSSSVEAGPGVLVPLGHDVALERVGETHLDREERRHRASRMPSACSRRTTTQVRDPNGGQRITPQHPVDGAGETARSPPGTPHRAGALGGGCSR